MKHARDAKIADLLKACQPRLRDIVDQKSAAEAMPLFTATGLVQTEEKITPQLKAAVLPPKLLEDLPQRFRKAAEDAAALWPGNAAGVRNRAQFRPLLCRLAALFGPQCT